MKISLLIDSSISNEITKVKTDLYKKDFRIDDKTDVGIPHIKLAEASTPDPDLKDQIVFEINQVYENYEGKALKNFQLVNEEQEETSWVALKIFDEWPKNLSRDIEKVLDKYSINETEAYKKKVAEIRGFDGVSKTDLPYCIADHLNLLNKCRKEKANEAEEAFRFLNEVEEIRGNGLLFEEE